MDLFVFTKNPELLSLNYGTEWEIQVLSVQNDNNNSKIIKYTKFYYHLERKFKVLFGKKFHLD